MPEIMNLQKKRLVLHHGFLVHDQLVLKPVVRRHIIEDAWWRIYWFVARKKREQGEGEGPTNLLKGTSPMTQKPPTSPHLLKFLHLPMVTFRKLCL